MSVRCGRNGAVPGARSGPASSAAAGDGHSVRSVSSEDVSYAPRGQCCAEATNPTYKRGRRLQLMQMLVLPFIPILALIVQTSMTLRDILVYRQEAMDVEAQVTIATDLGKVVTRMQLERSEVAFFIFTNGSTLRSNLTDIFVVTDQALCNMTTWPKVIIPGVDGDTVYSLDKASFQVRLEEFR